MFCVAYAAGRVLMVCRQGAYGMQVNGYMYSVVLPPPPTHMQLVLLQCIGPLTNDDQSVLLATACYSHAASRQAGLHIQ